MNTTTDQDSKETMEGNSSIIDRHQLTITRSTNTPHATTTRTTMTDRSNDAPKSRSRIDEQLQSIVRFNNLHHLFLGLLIGLCLALAISSIDTSSSASSRITQLGLGLSRWAGRHVHDTEDHRVWLGWHKIQVNNPFLPHHSASDDDDQIGREQDSNSSPSPTLREEIKKTINSNRWRVGNLKDVHPSDEL